MGCNRTIRAGILPALLALAAVGCSSDPGRMAASPGEAVAVRALEVKPEQVTRRVELVGTLEGQQEVTVSSEVSGPRGGASGGPGRPRRTGTDPA